jgi:predicted nucleic acid-binding protein
MEARWAPVIVVDTNVLAYLWVPGPATPHAERLLVRDPVWMAPSLWRSELRNVLVNYLRAGAATLQAAQRAMEAAEEQMTPGTADVDSASVLRLAARSGRSTYDCEFVALAESLEVPFVSADRKLVKAFSGIARHLEDFAAERG